MSKGAPSSRLLERARRLKQIADTLKNKVTSEKPEGRAKRRCPRRADCAVCFALLSPMNFIQRLNVPGRFLATVLAVLSHGPITATGRRIVHMSSERAWKIAALAVGSVRSDFKRCAIANAVIIKGR